MKWLKAIFGGGKESERIDSQNLTEADLRELTRDYLEVQADEGASGHPADYAATLTYVPPSSDFPGQWPGMPLCGCCSVPFAIDPRKSGIWVAEGARGKQAGTIVPLCAVCVTYLNRKHPAPDRRDRFPLPKTYDTRGQEISSKFPLDDLQRLAICRVALLRKTGNLRVTEQVKHDSKAAQPKSLRSGADNSRVSIEYFGKVRSLLAIKKCAEEFETLCGWDEEYGRATARVCAYAELSNENPVVVAAFMLESFNQYHKSRDVALSYLTRLSNGLKARAENPELAAKLDAEQDEKDKSDTLFKSINIASNSPEANYIREVDKFILSTGYYESLVLPAQDNDEFMEASINVYMAGYQTGSSPKVVGLLITDGANKYNQNPEFGIVFLDKVASGMRKRHSEAWGNGSCSENENNDDKDDSEDLDDIERNAEKYHKQIDEQIDLSYRFLRDNFRKMEGENTAELYSLKTLAVFAVHIASLVATNRDFPEIHRGTFNGLTRALSFRTPNTMPNIKPPNGMFVSYCSMEESFMHEQTETFQNQGLEPLVRNLLQHLGGCNEILYNLLYDHMERTSHQASKTYLPHLAEE